MPCIVQLPSIYWKLKYNYENSSLSINIANAPTLPRLYATSESALGQTETSMNGRDVEYTSPPIYLEKGRGISQRKEKTPSRVELNKQKKNKKERERARSDQRSRSRHIEIAITG
jgi:hypothetical protein